MFQRGPNKKIENSLVAMSSAAVLAVYAAGYTRTKSAADRMDAQSADRRPGPQGPGRGSAPVAPLPNQEPAPVVTAPVVTTPSAPGPVEPAAPPKLVASTAVRTVKPNPGETAPWLTPEAEATKVT